LGPGVKPLQERVILDLWKVSYDRFTVVRSRPIKFAPTHSCWTTELPFVSSDVS
jgi:hypothetical protein